MASGSLRSKVGKFLRRTGLYNIVMNSYRLFWRVVGVLTGREKRLFDGYQKDHRVHKLHIGCGTNYLDGWFNTDLFPNARRTRLNATRRFPFPDNSFDFIFSEHMIEHVPYEGGFVMLSECFRVLKPGGTIRIVTPDLQFLIGLYQDGQKPINKAYTEWNADLFLGKGVPHNAVSVINNFFRDWGHLYIFDVATMRETFAKIGFVDVIKADLKKSAHPELSGLEHDDRMPEGFLELESMVIEGKKPL